MSKILIIESCKECPHCFYRNFAECRKMKYEFIQDPTEIPEWCPLPDAEEKGGKRWIISEKYMTKNLG